MRGQEGPIERQKVDPSAGDGDYLCVTILNWELKNSKETYKVRTTKLIKLITN